MKKLIGVFQAAAPGIQILVDQSERLVGAANSEFQEALGLLLGRQVGYEFKVGISGAKIGSRRHGWRLNRSRRQRTRRV